MQLSLEGYYNGTMFHRVVQDFIAQGGDPTGTGEGRWALIRTKQPSLHGDGISEEVGQT